MQSNGSALTGGLGRISGRVLNSIVQSINAAVILHDRMLNVVFVNETFERIFEIKKENALGRSPLEFLPEFDRQHKAAIINRLEETLKTGTKSHTHEFPYCAPSGRYRHLSAVSIPIFDEANVLKHVMSIIQDITPQKELEQEAVKAAKLSSVQDMAYALAHEINNPLTGIKLGLSTLYDTLKKTENIQVLDSVMKDLNRIQKTVHSFLKAKRNRYWIKKESNLVIREIIDDVLFNLARQMDLQNIEVKKYLCTDEAFIHIDRDRIYQMLLNILLNAIQAIPGKGTITVSTHLAVPRGDFGSNRPFLCISLSDTGRGIESEHRGEVFRPFFSSKPRGTGLGLTICKEVVLAHKGLIEVDSDIGKGTTVRIWLPTTEA
jgi:two-component system sporulation sensor kinase A